jgi:uncharacterized protein involved in exopolysaccharide biosynthesis
MAVDATVPSAVISGEQRPNDDADDIDFARIWRVIRASRYLVLAVTVVCTAIALVIALKTTPIFRAETVVTSARNGNLGGQSGGQLGGLANIASLAGVNLDSGSSADREAKAVLQSRSLVQEFIARNDLIKVLRPQASTPPPTMWLAVKDFKEGVLSIRDDKRSGLLTIDVDWEDPVVAAKWANAFVALANERLRSRAIDEATRNIAFLNAQIPQTSVVDVQRAIYNLIESETKTLMLANVKMEFAFTVIDPAVPPEHKFRPKRSLYVLFGLFMGFAIGVLAAYVRSARAAPGA